MFKKFSLAALFCVHTTLSASEHSNSQEGKSEFIQSFIDEEKVSSMNITDNREPEKTTSKKEKVIIPFGKGLVLLGNKDDVLSGEELKFIEGLYLVDLCLPGSERKLDEILCPLYLEKPITWGDVLELKIAISKFYEKNGFPLVLIDIPKQDITEGVLQFIVTPSQLGQISVEGSCYTNECKLERYIQLKPEDPINQNILVQDLYYINRSPFRKADAVYVPGDHPGTTDIVLYLTDRRPYRFYAGVDDTGVKSTGRQRFFGGFNIGSLISFDDLFSFQFTSGYSTRKFQAYTAQYSLPLPWRHTVSIYGGYSSVHADLHYPNLPMKNHGDSAQASFRYFIPSYLSERHQGEWGIGGDYKRTNNNIEFTDFGTLFGQNVNLTQIFFGYSGEYIGREFTVHYGGQLYGSPGKILPDQSNQDYNSLRPGATNKWIFGRMELSYDQQLPGKSFLNLMGRGQLSASNLLPMEQFYIGGYNTVRGYEERQLNYDNGVILNMELRSPHFRVFTTKKPDKSDAAQFIAFFDYGYGRDHQKISGIKKNDYLIGTGPGIRYTYNPFLTGRLDWGFKLHKNRRFGGGSSMLHFSVIASY